MSIVENRSAFFRGAPPSDHNLMSRLSVCNERSSRLLSNEKKTCKLISKDTELTYSLAQSEDGKQSIRLGWSHAGGQCNARRFDVGALLDHLEELDRPFKTADVAKIIKVGCNNTAGFVIAILVHEGFATQLPQEFGKAARPLWFRLIDPLSQESQ